MTDDSRPLARFFCWLFGHDWRVLSIRCHRATMLGHLSTMAGALARCETCGKKWDDWCDDCRAVFEGVERAFKMRSGRP